MLTEVNLQLIKDDLQHRVEKEKLMEHVRHLQLQVAAKAWEEEKVGKDETKVRSFADVARGKR